MFQIPFDENLKIDEHLTWGTLKYGLCSYFALAYTDKHPSYNRFLALMEYDDELEQEYLVHFLIIDKEKFIDAYGTYTDWQGSVKDITDIEFMELRTKEVDKDFVRNMIQNDMGFDKHLFETIRNFADKAYC